MSTFKTPSRRHFLRGAAATAGAAVLATPFAPAFAAYPDRNINVVVPTSAGGGAGQMLRAFTAVWTKYLKANFEPSFFPGASGRVGYEVFMGKRDADCYNILFGNCKCMSSYPLKLGAFRHKKSFCHTIHPMTQLAKIPGLIFVRCIFS